MYNCLSSTNVLAIVSITSIVEKLFLIFSSSFKKKKKKKIGCSIPLDRDSIKMVQEHQMRFNIYKTSVLDDMKQEFLRELINELFPSPDNYVLRRLP